jgi:hypothetical protein
MRLASSRHLRTLHGLRGPSGYDGALACPNAHLGGWQITRFSSPCRLSAHRNVGSPGVCRVALRGPEHRESKALRVPLASRHNINAQRLFMIGRQRCGTLVSPRERMHRQDDPHNAGNRGQSAAGPRKAESVAGREQDASGCALQHRAWGGAIPQALKEPCGKDRLR